MQLLGIWLTFYCNIGQGDISWPHLTLTEKINRSKR